MWRVLSGMDVALRVIVAPNSAFAHIRDSDGGYFAWSVGISMLASVLWSGSLALLDPALGYWEAVARYVGMDLLTATVFAAVIYLVGRRLGGNGMWRTVFSAVFYTSVLALLAFALFAVLTLLAGGISVWAFLVDADQWDFESLEAGEPSGDMTYGPLGLLLGYLAVFIVGAIAFAVWTVVVLVKAVKTVNGFGTAKAFGIIVLALAVSAVVAAPFSM